MARIRTIKPEFWTDDVVGSLPRDARLLFLAALNLADDEGLLRWTPEYMKASAFMYDDDLTPKKVEGLMRLTEQCGLLFPYIGGRSQQRLAFIVNFRKHQKINRPQPTKLPVPSLQNHLVVRMYARRDGFACHICGATVNETAVGTDPRFNASPDHLVPGVEGGSDAPSNLATAHVGCNKARGARPVPASSPHAEKFTADDVNHSRNGSVNGAPPEAQLPMTPSTPEGNREQGSGTGNREQGTASPSAALALVAEQPASELPPGRRAQTLAVRYTEQVPLSKFEAVQAICLRAIRSARYSDDQIAIALDTLARDGRSVTLDSLRIALDGPPRPPAPRSTTADRVAQGLDVARRLAAQEVR